MKEKQNPYEKLREKVKKWGIYDEAFERLIRARRKSVRSLHTYSLNLKLFFAWLEKMPNDFVEICKVDPQKAGDIIADWVDNRIQNIGPNNADQHVSSIQAFLRMNQADKEIDFKLIRQNIPKFSRKAKDIAIPKEAIITLYSHADLRAKVVMQLLAHGLRESAFYFDVQIDQDKRGYYDYLKMKDVSVILQNGKLYAEIPFLQWLEHDINEEIVCGKLIVYRVEDEEYRPLITPEALHTIADYVRLRINSGEKINADSPLVRNIIAASAKMTNFYAERLSKTVKPLTAESIRREINYLCFQHGIRKTLVELHKGRHEFKLIHGWRKFADTTYKTYMRSDYAEYQLGHLTHYFRPELQQHIEEFKKIIPHLSLDKAKSLELELQKKDEKRIEELKAQLIPQVKAQVLAELISQLGANIKIESEIPLESH